MLYREIIAVCSAIHTEHINILCRQNVDTSNVKPSGTQTNHGNTNVKYAARVEDEPHSQYSSKATSLEAGIRMSSMAGIISLRLDVCSLSQPPSYPFVVRGPLPEIRRSYAPTAPYVFTMCWTLRHRNLNSIHCSGWRGFPFTGPFTAHRYQSMWIIKGPYSAPRPILKS